MKRNITIKFKDGSCDQPLLRKRLDDCLSDCALDGNISSCKLETVFPGADDPMLNTLFTAELETKNFDAVMEAVTLLEDIEHVHEIGDRKAI